jgi:hypothetical protein
MHWWLWRKENIIGMYSRLIEMIIHVVESDRQNVHLLCLFCNIKHSKTITKLSEISWNKRCSNCFHWRHLWRHHLSCYRNRLEKLAKGSLFYLFLKLVQINFIFSDNVRILYMQCICRMETIYTTIVLKALNLDKNK